MVGVHACYDDIEALFGEFDTDGNGTISFRELNRRLRRDVKAEGLRKKKTAGTIVDVADVDELRRAVKQGLSGIGEITIFSRGLDL